MSEDNWQEAHLAAHSISALQAECARLRAALKLEEARRRMIEVRLAELVEPK